MGDIVKKRQPEQLLKLVLPSLKLVLELPMPLPLLLEWKSLMEPFVFVKVATKTLPAEI